MNNIRFDYLYRDGSNYKNWADIVFSNPDGFSVGLVASQLRECFMEDGLFVAHRVRVPEVFLAADSQLTEDDHCFHEFFKVVETTEAPDDPHNRSIREFLTEVLRESHRGWQAFNPQDRLPRKLL
jgi:hypothetical protein